MSRKATEKQDGKESPYSDLPLFDYNLTAPPLSVDKGIEPQAQKKKQPIKTSPAPAKTGAARSTKPKILKAAPEEQVSAIQQSRHATEEANPVLLTVSDVCRLLKISRSTLIRIEKAGQLPGRLLLGGSVRYHRETIDVWLHGLAGNRS
jgi:excisionase family DNA binding protein